MVNISLMENRSWSEVVSVFVVWGVEGKGDQETGGVVVKNVTSPPPPVVNETNRTSGPVAEGGTDDNSFKWAIVVMIVFGVLFVVFFVLFVIVCVQRRKEKKGKGGEEGLTFKEIELWKSGEEVEKKEEQSGMMSKLTQDGYSQSERRTGQEEEAHKEKRVWSESVRHSGSERRESTSRDCLLMNKEDDADASESTIDLLDGEVKKED